MKKNLFAYLFTMLCSVALFSSCSDGNDAPGQEPVQEPVHPLCGTYALASYEVTDRPKANFPVSSPLYANWTGDASTENFTGIFRMMGAAILPQVLESVELKNDGNVCAAYIPNPTIKSDKLMGWGMGTVFGGFPKKDEVTALAATGGFVGSKDGLATWTESNGVFTLKLNLKNIIEEAAGKEDAAELVKVIEGVLNSEPAQIKGLLAGILGESINNITDATILQLKGWVLNGISLKAVQEGANLNLYLQKKDFDSMLTLRETGKYNILGELVKENDLQILWKALVAKGMIPEEAKMAGMMLQVISGTWEKTQDFDLGLSLVKK